jgi:hypothetical protein
MRSDRFTRISDGFDILGLRAQFRWRTPGSVCFHICRPYPELRAWAAVGWLDVHYPLLDREEFDSKTFLRGSIPRSVCKDTTPDAAQNVLIEHARRELEIQDRGGTFINVEFAPDRKIDIARLRELLNEMRTLPESIERGDYEATVFGLGLGGNFFPAYCQFHR